MSRYPQSVAWSVGIRGEVLAGIRSIAPKNPHSNPAPGRELTGGGIRGQAGRAARNPHPQPLSRPRGEELIVDLTVGCGHRIASIFQTTSEILGIIGLCTFGIMLLSTKDGALSWREIALGWTERPALLGLAVGAGYTVTADGRHAAWLVTAHVASGSLILVTGLLVALRSVRFAWRGSRDRRLPVEPRLAEAAR